MTCAAQPDNALMAHFGLEAATFIERTAFGTIWRARQIHGDLVCLKVYHGGKMRNEASGFRVLLACDGVAAARVYDLASGAAVLEWLDGPSLGDMARNGDDVQACEILADVARRFQQACHGFDASLPTLGDWFESLFRLEFAATCPPATQTNIAACRDLARRLLADSNDIAPLHGDLHHDNVRRGSRGYCAFDAKGVLGDRAYELANAFRNPRGAAALVRDPERIERLADVAAAVLSVDRRRVLAWAAVKTGLSIAWRAKGLLAADPEFDLLSVLLAKANDAWQEPKP